jgi:hypothetical protein
MKSETEDRHLPIMYSFYEFSEKERIMNRR